jgi:hypothetical protein
MTPSDSFHGENISAQIFKIFSVFAFKSEERQNEIK